MLVFTLPGVSRKQISLMPGVILCVLGLSLMCIAMTPASSTMKCAIISTAAKQIRRIPHLHGLLGYTIVQFGTHLKTLLQKPFNFSLRNPSMLFLAKSIVPKTMFNPFLDKIQAFRERMYRGTSFQFKFHIKIDIHRHVH